MSPSRRTHVHSDPLGTAEKGRPEKADLDGSPEEIHGRSPREGPPAEQLVHEHLPAVLLSKQNELDRLLNELNEISNALKSKASPDIQDLSDALMRAVRGAVRQSLLDKELCSLALTDDLTGLNNRRGFLALAHQQLKHAYRNSQEVLVFHADVDNLKHINDSYGHPEGDLAIMGTADALRRTFRNSDILARLGGDEFCILAMEAAIQNEKAIHERLTENLRLCNPGGGRYALSLSIGVARFNPRRPSTVQDLIAEADRKMYEEKRDRKERSRPAHITG
jgi:diguanylate cyclase (GGDEF)-like protein